MNLFCEDMKYLRCVAFLAALLAMAGCDSSGLTLQNQCDFPLLVVVTFHDGRRADVSLRPGQKQDVASPAETIDEIAVMSGGVVLYTAKPKGGLTKLTPDGVATTATK
jgi:hypothetical protein